MKHNTMAKRKSTKA